MNQKLSNFFNKHRKLFYLAWDTFALSLLILVIAFCMYVPFYNIRTEIESKEQAYKEAYHKGYIDCYKKMNSNS